MFDWAADGIAALNVTLFHIGEDAVSVAELFGFLTGGASVWLAMRGRIANFPVGIANSAFFLVLFAAARLWANAALQIVFIGLGFAGWRRWATTGAPSKAAQIISHAGPRSLAACIAFVVAATFLISPMLQAAGDPTPFLDALTTALSLAAQWLLNHRKIETWWFWIAADIIYVPLYASQGLYLTAFIYMLFLAMCLAAIGEWRRKMADPIESQHNPEAAT